MSSAETLLILLDYIARGAVLVVVFMLRWLFMLDKKHDLLEQELRAHKESTERMRRQRDQERHEILELVREHRQALHDHNDLVLQELRRIAGK